MIQVVFFSANKRQNLKFAKSVEEALENLVQATLKVRIKIRNLSCLTFFYGDRISELEIIFIIDESEVGCDYLVMPHFK